MLDSMAHMPSGAARWLHADDYARLDEPGATGNDLSTIMPFPFAIAKPKMDDNNSSSTSA